MFFSCFKKNRSYCLISSVVVVLKITVFGGDYARFVIRMLMNYRANVEMVFETTKFFRKYFFKLFSNC